MVEKELLELIACPESHQSLRQAPADLLARLNARIAQGTLQNRAGQRLQVPLGEGLLREDGRVLYPVLDGIPMLIVDEAVEVA